MSQNSRSLIGIIVFFIFLIAIGWLIGFSPFLISINDKKINKQYELKHKYQE